MNEPQQPQQPQQPQRHQTMLATSAILPAVLATRPAIPPIFLMVLTIFPNDAFSDG